MVHVYVRSEVHGTALWHTRDTDPKKLYYITDISDMQLKVCKVSSTKEVKG